jgi:hypothetical protein
MGILDANSSGLMLAWMATWHVTRFLTSVAQQGLKYNLLQMLIMKWSSSFFKIFGLKACGHCQISVKNSNKNVYTDISASMRPVAKLFVLISAHSSRCINAINDIRSSYIIDCGQINFIGILLSPHWMSVEIHCPAHRDAQAIVMFVRWPLYNEPRVYWSSHERFSTLSIRDREGARFFSLSVIFLCFVLIF